MIVVSQQLISINFSTNVYHINKSSQLTNKHRKKRYCLLMVSVTQIYTASLKITKKIWRQQPCSIVKSVVFYEHYLFFFNKHQLNWQENEGNDGCSHSNLQFFTKNCKENFEYKSNHAVLSIVLSFSWYTSPSWGN